MIKIHNHAIERIEERGTNKSEVIETIEKGEQFPVKFGRVGFRHNFLFEDVWRDKFYNTKQLEVYAVKENDDWIVITVITKFF